MIATPYLLLKQLAGSFREAYFGRSVDSSGSAAVPAISFSAAVRVRVIPVTWGSQKAVRLIVATVEGQPYDLPA